MRILRFRVLLLGSPIFGNSHIDRTIARNRSTLFYRRMKVTQWPSWFDQGFWRRFSHTRIKQITKQSYSDQLFFDKLHKIKRILAHVMTDGEGGNLLSTDFKPKINLELILVQGLGSRIQGNRRNNS